MLLTQNSNMPELRGIDFTPPVRLKIVYYLFLRIDMFIQKVRREGRTMSGFLCSIQMALKSNGSAKGAINDGC
jgi:hypothetical protein